MFERKDPSATIDWRKFYEALDGGSFSGTTSITPDSPGPTVRTFAVGARPMSTMMGIQDLSRTSTETGFPKLHLTWSCEMDTNNPHALSVSGRTPYVGTLPELSPIQSRVVFWFANDQSDVRAAPEGRYLDYVESDLVAVTAGGRTFTLPIPGYGATFSGRFVQESGTVKLYVDDKEVGSGKIEQTTPFKYSLSENQDIGRDTGTAVVEDYKVPFVFEGRIEQVVVELSK